MDKQLKIKLKVDSDSNELIVTQKEFAKLSNSASNAQKGVSKSFDTMKKSAIGFATAYASLESAKFVVNTFMDIENAQIAIAKTTGLSGQEFRRLTGEIDAMSVSMEGFGIHGLYDIAEAAGQLGIQSVDDIKEFTRVMGMVGITTDLTSKEAATSFAKLSNSLNEPISKVETLASVANKLSATTNANVGDLLKFSQRLSGGAKTAGLATDQIFALSATMTDLAINFETGGTNVNKVMLDLISDSDKFAEAIDEDFESFSRSVQDKPIAALQKLLVHMNSLGKTDAANFLTDLGYSGTEVKDVLLKLSSNTDILTKNLKTAHDEYLVGTDISNEYKTASISLSSQLTKVSGSLTLLASDFGKTLKDPILDVTDSILAVSESLRSMGVENIAKDMASLGVGIAGATISMKLFSSAMAFNKTLTLGSAMAEIRYTAALTAEVAVKKSLVVATRALAVSMRAIPFVAVTGVLTYMASEAIGAGDSIDYLNGKFEEGSIRAKEFSRAMASVELKKINSLAQEQSDLVAKSFRAIRHGADKAQREELRATYDSLKKQLENTLEAKKELLEVIKSSSKHTGGGGSTGSKPIVSKPKAEAFDEYGIPNQAEADLQKYTDAKIAASKRANDVILANVQAQIDATHRHEEAIQAFAEKQRHVNDIVIESTGTDYDKWLNGITKTIADMTDNGASYAQSMEVFNASLASFEQTGIDAANESMMSMLDTQIDLISSTNTWQNGLTGVAKATGGVSTAFAKMSVDNLKVTKAQMKLDAQYEKDKKKYGKDTIERNKIDQKYTKDTAKIKSVSTANELDGYSQLAGSASGFFEENSDGYKTLQAIQIGLQLAIQATAFADSIAAQSAIANSEIVTVAKLKEAGGNAVNGVTNAAGGDPYTAPARVAAMIALMASAFTMFDTGGGSGGGSVSIPSASANIQAEADFGYGETLARLDRQIELLESIDNSDGTVGRLTIGREQTDLAYGLESIKADLRGILEDNADKYDMKDALNYYAGNVGLTGSVLDYLSGMAGQTNLDSFQTTLFAPDKYQFQELLSSAQDSINEFSVNTIGVIEDLKDAGKSFEDIYDSLTDSTYFETKRLLEAQIDVDKLTGSKPLSEYLFEQVVAIDNVNKMIDGDLTTLLLSQDPADMQAQIDAVTALGEATGQVYEDGVESALNYLDSISLVADSLAEQAELLKEQALTTRDYLDEFLDPSAVTNRKVDESLVILGLDSSSIATQQAWIDTLTLFNTATTALSEEQLDAVDILQGTMLDFAEVTQGYIDTLKSVVDSIRPTIDKLRGGGSIDLVTSFQDSMSETIALSRTDDYEAFSDSLSKTISATNYLYTDSNFASSFDQEFAQSVAANQFEMLEGTTLTQIDLLTMIETNTRPLLEPVGTTSPVGSGFVPNTVAQAQHSALEDVIKELKSVKEELQQLKEISATSATFEQRTARVLEDSARGTIPLTTKATA